MNRSELLEADYNPREIDESARKKLRDNIKRLGLVEPIVVNQRTNHIVSGHQRIRILDVLEGKKDYLLDVAVVDLDEKTEKEQVIFLNNELAMGTFDIPKLEDVLRDADFQNCGFENFELEARLPEWVRQSEPAPLVPAVEPQDEIECRDVILVFKDRAATDSFMDLLKMSRSEKYISGQAVAELLEQAVGNIEQAESAGV